MSAYDMDGSPAPEAQKEAEPKKVSFRFCRECSNTLYPFEDAINSKLMFACKICHYNEPATTACIYRNALKEEIAETAGNVQDVAQDPTLPHSEDECANCGTRDAVFFQSQQRNKETGMALFFVCTECSHVWSTIKDDK